MNKIMLLCCIVLGIIAVVNNIKLKMAHAEIEMMKIQLDYYREVKK